jgi:hypothetical protein
VTSPQSILEIKKVLYYHCNMHITRTSRNTYQFTSDFFQPDGRVTFDNFAAARKFATQMSAHRTQPVPASDIYALSLIDEAMRMLLRHFAPSTVLMDALASVNENLGSSQLEFTEKKFVSEFPPENVYRGDEKVDEYLAKLTGGRVKTVEELIYVYTHNVNPAINPLLELVDDEPLEPTAYKNLIAALNSFFAEISKDSPNVQVGGESLFDILRAPSEASPDSLEGQLQFILAKWGDLLGETFVARIIRGIDFLREEVMHQNLTHGDFKPDIPVQSYSGGEYAEYERYSQDKEWMPRLVLIAKNSYVWLEQLSRKYGRWIKTLDQIPDEELDILRDRGFTGLWLIGLWERSRASQKIKQRMGDGDAVASGGRSQPLTSLSTGSACSSPSPTSHSSRTPRAAGARPSTTRPSGSPLASFASAAHLTSPTASSSTTGRSSA